MASGRESEVPSHWYPLILFGRLLSTASVNSWRNRGVRKQISDESERARSGLFQGMPLKRKSQLRLTPGTQPRTFRAHASAAANARLRRESRFAPTPTRAKCGRIPLVDLIPAAYCRQSV